MAQTLLSYANLKKTSRGYSSGQSKNLIVEDEVVVAKEIYTILGNLGYMVTSIVKSGEDAVKQAELIYMIPYIVFSSKR